MKHYLIYPEDVKWSALILYWVNPSNKCLELREGYNDLTCSLCGRVYPLQALARGVDATIRIPGRMPDFFASEDALTIVSQRMRTFLEDSQLNVNYFAFPSTDKFFVAVPEQLFLPDPENNAFQTTGYCERCGRVGNCIWGTELYEVPKDLCLGAFWFEGRAASGPVWVASERIVQELKRSKFKGLFFQRYFKDK